MIHFCTAGVAAFNNAMQNLAQNLSGIADLIPAGLDKLNSAIQSGMAQGAGGAQSAGGAQGAAGGGLTGSATGDATGSASGTADATGSASGTADATASASGSASAAGSAAGSASGAAAGTADLPPLPVPAAGMDALANTANTASAMNNAFGIDMASPTAGDKLGALFNSIGSSGLGSALAGMPFSQMPAISALQGLTQALGNCMNGLGMNLFSPTAGDALGAIMNGDFSGMGSANLSATGDATGTADATGSASGTAAAGGTVSGDISSLASAQIAVQNAFGINMMQEGGVTALSNAMGVMSDTMSNAPNFAGALPMDTLGQAMGMMGGLSAITQGLGTNLLNPGMGDVLKSTLSSLQENGVADLLKKATAAQMANITQAVAQNMQSAMQAAATGSATGTGSASATGSTSASAAMDATANVTAAFGIGISAAGDATAAGQIGAGLDQMMSEGLGNLISNIPPPNPSMGLGAMLNSLTSSAGINLTASGPCGNEGCSFSSTACPTCSQKEGAGAGAGTGAGTGAGAGAGAVAGAGTGTGAPGQPTTI